MGGPSSTTALLIPSRSGIEDHPEQDLSAEFSFAADLPSDLLEGILLRLPVKSLVRFSFTCKSFRSLIRNPNFVAEHAHRAQVASAQSNDFSFLVNSNHSLELQLCSVSDSARRCDRLNLASLLSSAFKSYKQIEVIGCCRGIICFSCRSSNGFWMTCIWNPAIREIKVIAVDTFRYSNELYGFGYHNGINDYTYVRFPQFHDVMQLKVYSVCSGTWKFSEKFVIEAIDPPICRPPMVCINGFCYWVAYEYVGEEQQLPIVMVYDLVTGTLKDIKLPLLNSFNDRSSLKFLVKISEMNGKLCMVDYRNESIEFWVMDDENRQISWTKRFSQTLRDRVLPSFLFTRSGEIVWHEDEFCNMVMRKPGSDQEIKLPISLCPGFDWIFRYEETLQSVHATTLIDKQLICNYLQSVWSYADQEPADDL